MAKPDNPPTLLHTPRSHDDVTQLGGYHRELFLKEFSIIEEALVICNICQGVKKEASMYQGLTTCKVCSPNPDGTTAVKDIRELVGCLSIRCPLYARGCAWKGSVVDVESHLRTCKELLLPCPAGCGVGIRRASMEKHIEECMRRNVACEHCGSAVSAKSLEEHLTTCKDCIVACPQCNHGTKRSQLDEHMQTLCGKSAQLKLEHSNQAQPEGVRDAVSSVYKQQENIIEKLLSDKIANLENEAVALKDRVLSLERKSEVLTKALLCRPELAKYDSVTGRILEGFSWTMLGIEQLTKIVFTFESQSFYISHLNLVLVASVGMVNSVSFSVTRIPGRFDEIVETSALSFYRCEVVSAKEGGDPFIKSERINHQQLKLGEKCQPFGFIDVSVLRDAAYCSDDRITLHFYFDLTH